MDEISLFWNGWEPVVRILVVGTLAYVSLVLLLRITVKRTLAQLNAFDFIVTVALGASFGRILTARQVVLAEAMTAFALLVVLQIVFSVLKQRSERFADAVTAPPTVLFYQGRYVREKMHEQRISEDELATAVRLKGGGTLDKVEAIILEPNGKLAVVKKQQAGDGALLENLDRAR